MIVWSLVDTTLTIGLWEVFYSIVDISWMLPKQVIFDMGCLLVHGIHMGIDTYWKRSIRSMTSIKDFYYNKRVTRPNYPWTSLVYSNYTTCIISNLLKN